jgi:hypothetical protein
MHDVIVMIDRLGGRLVIVSDDDHGHVSSCPYLSPSPACYLPNHLFSLSALPFTHFRRLMVPDRLGYIPSSYSGGKLCRTTQLHGRQQRTTGKRPQEDDLHHTSRPCVAWVQSDLGARRLFLFDSTKVGTSFSEIFYPPSRTDDGLSARRCRLMGSVG